MHDSPLRGPASRHASSRSAPGHSSLAERRLGFVRAATPALAFSLALVLAACGPEEAGEVADEHPVEETIEASPPGETVERLRVDKRPGTTVYEPPPDLSRKEDGVVFIPSEGEG